MQQSEGIRKFGLDKVVLLGIFAASLLIAYLLTASRSAIRLSEPIELKYSGLSVQIPIGNGWKSKKTWRFQDNSFVLRSFFNPAAASVAAVAQCQYLLAPVKTDPNAYFSSKATEFQSKLVKTGTVLAGALPIRWAHIQKPQATAETFLGILELPSGYQLNIEVSQIAGDSQLAKQAFTNIASNVKFEHSKMMKAGSEIVAEIKDVGLNSFLYEQNQQIFSIIRDSKQRSIGFAMDFIAQVQTDKPLSIRATSLVYTQQPYPQEKVTFFQSDNTFDMFTWRTEDTGPTGKIGYEIILDDTALMTVRELSRQPMQHTYRLSGSAVPEIILEFALGRLLDKQQDEILLDIINFEGRIIPALISQADSNMTATASEQSGGVLRIKLLDGSGFFHLISFDTQKQISTIVLHQQQNVYTIERTSVENILREFPELTDYILEKRKILQEQLSY